MTDSLEGSGQCVCGHSWFEHCEDNWDNMEIEPCGMTDCSCKDFQDTRPTGTEGVSSG